ncbi:MAG TPA: ATP-binding cassette domain-containing protein [Candidatus Dormibacteraeota bacterium]|nr:ATP-binding cassette domain-containing protein [Candidatus Dormibacteraeota bacterium]
MTAVLELSDVSAGYGPMQVVHDVNLAIAPGTRVGLVGLNGHGKTTLLRSVVGLVDWKRGRVELRGKAIGGLATHEVARKGLVLIPQGDSLFPGLPVRDNLDSGAFLSKSWRRRAERRARVLELFPQLAGRLDQLAGTLSGGERRMVAIGRGLMADADVYLVDEPSLGLAPGLAAKMIEALLSLELDGGAMLLAEQNRALIEGRVDRIVRIHGGRIAAEG